MWLSIVKRLYSICYCYVLAEREGFEPSVEFPLHTLSKRARSTTPPSLRFRINGLRAVWNSVAQNPPSNSRVPQIDSLQHFADVRRATVSGIVSDLPMSLDHVQ